MSTPEQHQQQAESLLTGITEVRGASLVSPDVAAFDVIAAHSYLARATGTGTHYPLAEAELVKAGKNFPHAMHHYRHHARIALAHARLADR